MVVYVANLVFTAENIKIDFPTHPFLLSFKVLEKTNYSLNCSTVLKFHQFTCYDQNIVKRLKIKYYFIFLYFNFIQVE